MDIGILVFPDAEELDFAGPWEAFGVWSRDFPADGVTLRLLAESRDPVRCHKGLRVLPDAARGRGRRARPRARARAASARGR